MAVIRRTAWLANRLPSRTRLVELWKEGDAVFGKPHWFRPKTATWGITPVRWQGWAYAVVWMAVIAGPFVFLLAGRGAIEAILWIIAAMSVLVCDVRQIRRRLRNAADEDSLASDGGGPRSADLATRNFRMRLKNAAR